MILSFRAAMQNSGFHSIQRSTQALAGQDTATKAEAYYFVNQSERSDSSLNDKYLLATVFERLYKKLSPHELNLTFLIKTVEILILQGLYEEALNFIQLGIQSFSETPQLIILKEKLLHLKERSESYVFGFHKALLPHEETLPLEDCEKWIRSLHTELEDFLLKSSEFESDSNKVMTTCLYFQFKKIDARFKQVKNQLCFYTEQERKILTESVKILHSLKDRAQLQLEMNLILLLLQSSLQQIYQEINILRPLMKYGIELDDELETIWGISELLQAQVKNAAFSQDRQEIMEFEVLKQVIQNLKEKVCEANLF